MKKPERKVIYNEEGLTNEDDREDIAFNQGYDDIEAYYKQEIKENYIRKDKLPSENEIINILIEANNVPKFIFPCRNLYSLQAKAIVDKICK